MNVLLPWIAYVAFGVITSVLLAVAMRTIPTATAFAVWMAGSLIFLKLTDVFWLKAGWSATEVFFGFVIIVGIIGLKWGVQRLDPIRSSRCNGPVAARHKSVFSNFPRRKM